MAKRSRNKTNLDVTLQSLVAGVKRHLGTKPIQLLGKTWTPEELEEVLLDHLSELRGTNTLYNQWKVALARYHTRYETELLPLIFALRAFVEAAYGPQSDELGHFGFKARRPRTQTPESKLLAARKARATRKARKTMGRKQREKIHGEVASEYILPTQSTSGEVPIASPATKPRDDRD